MALKLKEGCWYECDRDDWREIVVCGFAGVVEPGEGPVIVRANIEPGSEMDLFAIDEEGQEICILGAYGVPMEPIYRAVRHGEDMACKPWDEVAHAALVERGWFSPWEPA